MLSEILFVATVSVVLRVVQFWSMIPRCVYALRLVIRNENIDNIHTHTIFSHVRFHL